MTMSPAGYVAGRQIFIDLWSLAGFIPVLCESPADAHGLLSSMSGDGKAFVVVEQEWFDRVPEATRRRMERSHVVWIQFPSATAGR
ncbi:MAG TPA: cell division protein [Synergistaceae bacterium]|nr:cell division protein [Synergistaceae bacterium]